MHLAFVSPFDTNDVRAWSGIPYYVARALEGQVDKLSVVAPLRAPVTWRQVASYATRRLRGAPYLRDHTEEAARAIGVEASRRIRAVAPDAVLALGSTTAAFLEVRQPLGFWSDATFESNLEFYSHYSGLDDQMVLEGNRVEASAQERAHCACYASAYAARSATGYYGTDPTRVHVIPFGSNLVTPPSADAVERAVADRPLDRCRLLFLGADWTRKGGDVAVRVADELNRSGLPTELAVAGSSPTLERARPYVRSLGFLDKGTPEGRRQFDTLLASSHFLLLPSRAEAFGCVFGEAGAYGVPALTVEVGGIPSAVETGVSGHLFPPRPAPSLIAERVRELLGDPDAYRSLCQGARARYERELNWPHATRQVVEILAGLLR